MESIQRKLLVFGIVATLVPSFGIAYSSYVQNKRVVRDKIAQELATLSGPGARDVEIWLKSHLLDLRVFAGSEILVGTRGGSEAKRTDYLQSVRAHFSDYEALAALDPQGHAIAISSRGTKSIPLPDDWGSMLRNSGAVIGEPFRTPSGHIQMVLAVPIQTPAGRANASLAAIVDLKGLADNLSRFVPKDSGRFYVTTGAGLLVAGKGPAADSALTARLSDATIQNLTARSGQALEYTSFGKKSVLGTMEPVDRLHWAAIAEVPSTAAFRQIEHLRNVTTVVVAIIFLSVGLMAYALGLLIVHPLDRLSEGAATVAQGNLTVDLPVVGGGEVGRLTEVFNHMVGRIREGRDALQKLSVTDGLTGLYNRRRLMETLDVEAERSERGAGPFSVLMVDVDHFKKYNDTHGHQAGDEVLTRVAGILKEVTRQVDCAARYGGEEFLVLLPQTAMDGAAEVAERLRTRLKATGANGGGDPVTVSVGVAEFPKNGDTTQSVIAAADAALYRAKADGRDRVVRSAVSPKPTRGSGANARRRRDG
ncbi:MAG TPA: diguanylate cyclase [Gemmatimonadales bacterium]|nr:diguanylate cyclase [Gemmatimonadales bacterium]